MTIRCPVGKLVKAVNSTGAGDTFMVRCLTRARRGFASTAHRVLSLLYCYDCRSLDDPIKPNSSNQAAATSIEAKGATTGMPILSAVKERMREAGSAWL